MKTKALSFYLMVGLTFNLVFFQGALFAAVEETNYEKANLGVFGGRVCDVTAYDNSGTSEILVGAESIRGIYKWDGVSSWQQTTYLNPNYTGTSPIYGQGLAVEANLASGYENDIYAIIHEVSSGGGGSLPTVYCSDDGGDSWSTIATSINDPSVLLGHSSGMYVGTNDGHVYRNTGGYTDPFSLIYSAAVSDRITSISVFDAGNYYVMGTSGGTITIFDRVLTAGSFNIGDSYTIQSIGTTDFTVIGAASNTVGVVFTVTGAGSGTGTASTSLISTLPATSYSGGTVEVHLVGVDPADVDTIFIAGSSANPQVYLSTDGGATWPSSWDRTGGNFPGGYGDYIKFNNNRVFITTVVLEKSGTWASTWGAGAPLLTTGAITSHPNGGSALQVDPVDNTIIYMDSDWGLGKMNHTYGSGWTAGTELGSNNGMDAVVLSGIDFYEYSPTSKELWITSKSGAGRVYNSTTGQIYDPNDPTTTDDPSDWLYPIYPMDDGAPLTTVTIDPNNPANVYLGNTAGKVYKTINGTATTLAGFSWSQSFDVTTDDPTNVFGTTTPEHSEITAIGVQDFNTCSRLYISGYNWETNEEGGIFYSDDGGLTWTADTMQSSGMEIDFPVNTLYVTDYKVWAGVGNDQGSSTESGLLWRGSLCGSTSFSKPTTGVNLDNEVVTDIDGRYDSIAGVNRVYVTTYGGVYRGDKPASTWSWQDLTANIGSPITDFVSVTVNPSDEDNAFVAVGNCIYETSDGGTTWNVLSGTCGTSNEDVKVLKYDDLLAGTATGIYSLSSTDEGGDSAVTAPTLNVTTSGTTVSLSWTSVAGATGYTLYYAPYPYTGPDSIGNIPMGTQTSISASLWDGAAFFVALQAYDSVETSGYSNIEFFTIDSSQSNLTFTKDTVSLGITGVSPEAVLWDDGSVRLYVTGGIQGMTLYRASDGLTFTEETGSLPLGGSDPTLIRLGDGTYRMYYNDRDTIKTATSPDGLAWTEESSTGISNTNNNEAWGVPDSVELPDGRIRLYWVDTPVYVSPPNGYEVVKSAVSADGLTFTEESGYRTEDTNGEGGWADPHVLLAEEGNWIGLFSYIPPFKEENPNVPMTLHVGTSTDGLTWSIESEPIITATGGHVGDPTSYPLGDGSYRVYHVATSELNPPHNYFITSGILKPK